MTEKFELTGAGVPVYTGNTAKSVKISHIFARFNKGDDKHIEIEGRGLVELEKVNFRLLQIEDIYSVFNDSENRFVHIKESDNLQDETQACILVLQVDNEYFTRILHFRGALNSVSQRLNYLNIEIQDSFKGTQLEDYPYVINNCSVTLKLVTNKAKSRKYLKAKKVERIDRNDKEISNFVKYLESSEFKEQFALCQNVLEKLNDE